MEILFMIAVWTMILSFISVVSWVSLWDESGFSAIIFFISILVVAILAPIIWVY